MKSHTRPTRPRVSVLRGRAVLPRRSAGGPQVPSCPGIVAPAFVEVARSNWDLGRGQHHGLIVPGQQRREVELALSSVTLKKSKSVPETQGPHMVRHRVSPGVQTCCLGCGGGSCTFRPAYSGIGRPCPPRGLPPTVRRETVWKRYRPP